MIEVAEKPHARLGASGFHTWGACPGSDVLGEGIDKPSSRYAKEGTAAHALLEHCLEVQGIERGAGFLDAEHFIGEEIIVEGEVFIVDNDMADAVNSAIDIVRSYMIEGDMLFVESEVPIDHLTGEEEARGTCDIAIVSADGTTLTIADYKHGQGVMVYASEKEGGAPNGQLAMYASGWLQANGFLYEEITTIRLAIIQPRMEWHDEHTISIEELRAFEDVIREAAGRVELNRQYSQQGGVIDLNPGEKQCKFCKAKGICPALREASTKALAIVADPSRLDEFEDLSVPKKAAAVVVNEGVTNERLSEFLRAVPLIEQAIEAAGTEALRRLTAGQELPGFYLGVGRAGRRAWANEEEARKELTKSGRLKVSEATVAKVRSPTQIEKLAGKTRWWPKVAPLIVQPEGGPKVCQVGVDRNATYKIASDVSEFQDLTAVEQVSAALSAPNPILREQLEASLKDIMD
jgi:hypothetical protein